MPFEKIESYYEEVVKPNMLWQFEESQRIQAYFHAGAEACQIFEDEVDELYSALRFSQAEGKNLDIWGLLVGEPRSGLEDDDYRRFIRARVRTNLSVGTEEEILEIWKLVTDSEDVHSVAGFPAAYTLTAVMDAVPTGSLASRISRFMRLSKPLGVDINIGIGEPGYFGFDGNPDAGGFGSPFGGSF